MVALGVSEATAPGDDVECRQLFHAQSKNDCRQLFIPLILFPAEGLLKGLAEVVAAARQSEERWRRAEGQHAVEERSLVVERGLDEQRQQGSALSHPFQQPSSPRAITIYI